MGKCLHKFFKAVVNEIKNVLPNFGASCSEVSHLIPEPRNFVEVTRLPEYFKKVRLKENLKYIKNLSKNQTFLMDDPDKGDPVTPRIDVYKANIKSYESLENLNLIIVVRGDLHNKEIIGDTWDPTVSMRTLKYFLAYDAKKKVRLHQLDFIGVFLKAYVKHCFCEYRTVDVAKIGL